MRPAAAADKAARAEGRDTKSGKDEQDLSERGMTECLDRGIEPRRLRGISLQGRDDHEYTRACEHHALGDVTGRRRP